jgi:hypothetical protein
MAGKLTKKTTTTEDNQAFLKIRNAFYFVSLWFTVNHVTPQRQTRWSITEILLSRKFSS